MKRNLFRIPLSLFLVCLCALLALGSVGCRSTADGEDETRKTETLSYEGIRMSDVLSPFSYTGLTVELTSADALKSEAVWYTVLSEAEVISYPEHAVAYYAEQRRETYRYYADKNGWSYAETLGFFDTDEEAILEEAREMVKGDLVFRYIVEDAGLSLTDADKQLQTDRYVEKFAADYGYTEEYVREHMLDLVYDSMLYDKTMEYLMVNNTFVQK